MALLELLRLVTDITIMDMMTATSMVTVATVTVDMATLVIMRLLARRDRLGAPRDLLVEAMDHRPWIMARVDGHVIMDMTLHVVMDLAVAGDLRLPGRIV